MPRRKANLEEEGSPEASRGKPLQNLRPPKSWGEGNKEDIR